MEKFQAIFDEVEETLDFGWLSFYPTIEEQKRWSKNHTRFECTLECNDVYMTFDFFSSRVPSLQDVVEHLVIDSQCVRNNATFDNFCDNYGYNNDSIKDLKLYEKCKGQAQNFKSVLGETLFERFMSCDMSEV